MKVLKPILGFNLLNFTIFFKFYFARNYKSLDIAKSDRPLTNPASPNWVAKGKVVNSTYTNN